MILLASDVEISVSGGHYMAGCNKKKSLALTNPLPCAEVSQRKSIFSGENTLFKHI